MDLTQARQFHTTLLNALEQSPHLRLDLDRTTEIDLSFGQLIAGAYQSCIRKNGSFGFASPPREPVARSLRNYGLTWLLGSAP